MGTKNMLYEGMQIVVSSWLLLTQTELTTQVMFGNLELRTSWSVSWKNIDLV